ncbi:MAG: hypothetical protein U9N81_13240 [Bacillota bacterium]|nr:hypothetical protein [Bacillota bacterium]
MPATSNIPAWFWILYYSLLIITFGVSILTIIRKRNRLFSIINLAIVITVPIISLINSIGMQAANEFLHLIIHLKQGDLWAFYVFAGYAFILVWWLFFIRVSVKVKNL